MTVALEERGPIERVKRAIDELAPNDFPRPDVGRIRDELGKISMPSIDAEALAEELPIVGPRLRRERQQRRLGRLGLIGLAVGAVTAALLLPPVRNAIATFVDGVRRRWAESRSDWTDEDSTWEPTGTVLGESDAPRGHLDAKPFGSAASATTRDPLGSATGSGDSPTGSFNGRSGRTGLDLEEPVDAVEPIPAVEPMPKNPMQEVPR